MYDTIETKDICTNINENLELIVIPRPKEDDFIRSCEGYIDSQIQKIEYEKLKQRVHDDIIHDVMDRVRKEFLTSTCIDTRNRKKKNDLEEMSEVVKLLKAEIEFLREEVKQKNNTINFLTAKSLLHNESIFSHDENRLKTPQNLNIKHDVPRDEIIMKDNDTLTQYDNYGRTKQLLEDQLTCIRLQKHEHYVKSKEGVEGIKKSQVDANVEVQVNKNVRQSVIVCGDSMVNGLDGNGVSSKLNQVSVRSFSGATSEDMIDYCKPLVSKKPDKLIFHFGTNDLTKNIENSKANFESIIEYVKQISPKTEIVLSNICLRMDNPKLDPKRIELNKSISMVAEEYGLKIIDNKNIDRSCLAKKKLHLNGHIGLPRLAKNIKQHLKQQY